MTRFSPNRSRLRGTAGVLTVGATILLGGCAGPEAAESAALIDSSPPPAAAVPTPTVMGPVASSPIGDLDRNYPYMASNVGLEALGYVEEEFFIEGEARSYTTPELSTGTELEGTTPYRTRIVVRRPRFTQQFNGVVAVEWYNVTGQADVEYDWFNAYEYLLRSGWAWVGVSAQKVGVDALREWSPERYGSLDVSNGGTVDPQDALSYDIFSQVVQALRQPAGVAPLGDLEPRLVIAIGHSQSGRYLSVYHNSIHPLHGLVDGFAVRGTSTPLRKDLDVKVFRLMAEGDVRSRDQSEEPDTDNFRRWEAPGTSHVAMKDQMAMALLRERDRRTSGAAPPGPPIPLTSSTPGTCELNRYSRVPFQHIMNAAYDHLVHWIEDGTPPPRGPRLEWATDSTKARDAYGNALGGIRIPEHEVATAVNTGDNPGPGFCRLMGSYEAFAPDVLRSLYPTPEAYVARIEEETARAVSEGFILPEDAQASVEDARRMAARW
jgi:hypothetical protein